MTMEGSHSHPTLSARVQTVEQRTHEVEQGIQTHDHDGRYPPNNHGHLEYALIGHTHEVAPPEPPEPPPEPPPTTNDRFLSEFNSIQEGVNLIGVGETLVIDSDQHITQPVIWTKPNRHLRLDNGARIYQDGETSHGFVFHDVDGGVSVQNLDLYMESYVHPGGPNPIRVEGCHGMTFLNTWLERTHSWGFVITHRNGKPSHDVTLDGFINRNRLHDNQNIDDGLDLAGYNHTVRNFDINTNDDGISIKNLGVETHHITLENGIIRSRDAGLTFGSHITKPMHDILVKNLTFIDCGIPIFVKMYQSYELNELWNVEFVNITQEGESDRFIDFLTRYSFNYNKAHDFDFVNINFNGTLSDRLGYGQCVLHAERQGPNLRGIENVSCS